MMNEPPALSRSKSSVSSKCTGSLGTFEHSRSDVLMAVEQIRMELLSRYSVGINVTIVSRRGKVSVGVFT